MSGSLNTYSADWRSTSRTSGQSLLMVTCADRTRPSVAAARLPWPSPTSSLRKQYASDDADGATVMLACIVHNRGQGQI